MFSLLTFLAKVFFDLFKSKKELTVQIQLHKKKLKFC